MQNNEEIHAGIVEVPSLQQRLISRFILTAKYVAKGSGEDPSRNKGIKLVSLEKSISVF